MKIFVTADHHFFHKNIIRYCKRPFKSVEEMNEVMIEKWNDKVSKEDLVIHLGDFCFGGIENIKKIRPRLNGTILLVRGNHDYNAMREYGFIIVGNVIQIGRYILTHRPVKVQENLFNIHGHVHEKESEHGLNVGVDKTNFEPVEFKYET